MTSTFPIVITSLVAAVLLFLAILLVLRGRYSHARLHREGFQEMEIVVKGKYRPDFIVIRRGIPTRLHFIRQEDIPCSERVIFSDFHDECRLPAFHSTSVCFIPTRCGEFLFTCAFGMYQGRMVVVEPTRCDLALMRAATSPRQDEKLPHLAAGSWTTLGFTSRGADKGNQDSGAS